MLLRLEFKFFVLYIALWVGPPIPQKCYVCKRLALLWYGAVLHAGGGSLFLVTFSTMLSTCMLALLEVACPLAAFGGSMRPCTYVLHSSQSETHGTVACTCTTRLPLDT